MDTPFLQQIARHYVDTQGLEDYCFVFPNRRSGQFFTRYLQQELVDADHANGVAGSPHLMPRVTSINDLVDEVTGTVAASDIEMMFALYEAYCQAMETPQEFDRFIYWAQLIVSDFNDIDRSLADACEIYQNLEDLHDLTSNYLSPEVKKKVKDIFGDSLFTAFFDTDADANLWRLLGKERSKTTADDEAVVKQEFLSLWQALATIYDGYHQELKAKGVIAPGRQLRLAAEDADVADRLDYRRFAFVGFGVLSAAEVKLFDRFGSKADFWWDNAGIQSLLDTAPHDPGALLIDGYCKRFKANPTPLDALGNKDQELKAVAVPSTVGQAKRAFDELEMMCDDGRIPGIDSAIVLPDESLLVPLLHSVHGVSRLNVTLGYPLHSSGIVSLMHIVARMHHQASPEHDVWTYYREDVNDILSHPLIKTYFTAEALTMVNSLARSNRFRIPASEFEGLTFGALFTPAMSGDGGNKAELHMGYIDNLLSFSNLLMEKMTREEPEEDDDEAVRDGVKVSLQQAFLVMYIDVLNQLKRSLAECGQTLQQSTVFYLIDRLTASAIVPFTGEPLQGLQVMGLLETRSLDFRNVVILSMNERIFPRRRGINSFIPNYIRRAHGMSTIEQQEAIVAFNFYRLLNRAERVTFIYDSRDQKLGSSEPSRYLSQLEKVYGRDVEHVEMNPVVLTSSSLDIAVPHSAAADLGDRYTRDPEAAGGKYLSASAINLYINCQLQFYLHYVEGLNNDNTVSDFMDYGTFGTIIHDTLGDCYDNELVRNNGGKVTKEYLVSFKNRLEAAVVRNIKKTYLRLPEDQLDDGRPLQGEAYMLIDTIMSYVRFVINHDIDLLAEPGSFLTILECEQTHKLTPLEIGGVKFNFTYKPDRIDRLPNGKVRIVDYKTGSDHTSFRNMDDLFSSSKGHDRRKAILQLFLYSYAYLTENKDIESVDPVIYRIAQMSESGVKLNGDQFTFKMNDDVVKDFVSKLAGVINTLYQGDFEQAAVGAYACNYCRFIDFCRRAPK